MRACDCANKKIDETSLTVSLVDGSSLKGTLTTLGKTFLHGTRNTSSELCQVEYTSRWWYRESAIEARHILLQTP
jgi:hypothetical protein